eukprot:827283_1
MTTSNQKTMATHVTSICIAGWPWLSSCTLSLIAYKMRNVDLKYRWWIGFIAAKGSQYVQNYANAELKKILPPIWSNCALSLRWLLINNLFAMQYGSGWVSMFGGQNYFQKHGIDSYEKAMIAWLCPGIVYFRNNKNARKKAIRNLTRIAAVLGVGYAASLILPTKRIESNVILHMEVLAMFTSLLAFASNIPCNVHYFLFGGNDDIEVIEPYDFVYFSQSIRTFWKNCSRPVGQTLRYMVYEPLGGRDRFWLSVP